MSVERMVLVFAGSFILVSIALSLFFSPYWLLFTALRQLASVSFYRLLPAG